MATRHECDVAGCDNHASMVGGATDGTLHRLPAGWYCQLFKLTPPKQPDPVDSLEANMKELRRRRRMERRLFRQVIICDKHPSLDFKPAPPPSPDDLDHFVGIDDDYAIV